MTTKTGQGVFPFVIGPNTKISELDQMTTALEGKSFRLECCYKTRGNDFWNNLLGEGFPKREAVVQELSGKKAAIAWVYLDDAGEKDTLKRYEDVQEYLKNVTGIFAPIEYSDWIHMYEFMRNSSDFPEIAPVQERKRVYFPVIMGNDVNLDEFLQIMEENQIKRGISILSGSLTVFLEIDEKMFKEINFFLLFAEITGVESPSSQEELDNWLRESRVRYNYPPTD
jgi:hypothetical protein